MFLALICRLAPACSVLPLQQSGIPLSYMRSSKAITYLIPKTSQNPFLSSCFTQPLAAITNISLFSWHLSDHGALQMFYLLTYFTYLICIRFRILQKLKKLGERQRSAVKHRIYECGVLFDTKLGPGPWPLLPFSYIFRYLAMPLCGCSDEQ